MAESDNKNTERENDAQDHNTGMQNIAVAILAAAFILYFGMMQHGCNLASSIDRIDVQCTCD